MEATITEIFRVAPTAPGSLPHMTIKDTEICGYRIPKGTQVWNSIETDLIFQNVGSHQIQLKGSTWLFFGSRQIQLRGSK